MTLPPGCPHGMPSPASCVDCMNEGPVASLARSRVEATRWMEARYPGRCASDDRHRIEPGDRIGAVDMVGWCCALCATGGNAQ